MIKNYNSKTGQIEELTEEEAQLPAVTPEYLDSKAEAATSRRFDNAIEDKALLDVMADLAVAAGLAPNKAAALAEVRNRFRTAVRNQL